MEENLTPDFLEWIRSVNGLDWIGLGLSAFFILLGVIRGLRWQFLRFLGVLLAIFASRLAAPFASPHLTRLIDPEQPRVGLGISYLLIFLLSLAVLSLLLRFLKLGTPRVRDEKLEELGLKESKPKHRILGGCFGFLTAAELYAVLIASLLFFGSEGSIRQTIDSSRAASLTTKVISFLGGGFPLEIRQFAKEVLLPKKPK